MMVVVLDMVGILGGWFFIHREKYFWHGGTNVQEKG